MEVVLEPAERRLRGTQRIRWRNTTDAPTSELRFHLYLNAFRDARSTLMREADEEFRRKWRDADYGGIRVTQLELETADGPVDLTPQLHFAQPDDGNSDDATVLVAPLPTPVGAGAAAVVRTRFEVAIPKAHRRTGYAPDDGFFMMHWFPKLGVLESRGEESVWNCPQFHANSEFFADFSVYEVAITLPPEYVVGATGQLQTAESTLEGSSKTLVYRAEDVHDFAWVADPDFVEHRMTTEPVRAADDEVATAVAAAMQTPVEQFDLPATEIILLLRPEHDTETQRHRHFAAVRAAIEFFGLRYGPYPYPTITVVDPARDVLGNRLGGGMEYPQLITCGTSLFPHPHRLSPEGVTVHEFGHQYWYGLSANDEFREAWLDEGINTFSEGRAQWLHYGEQRPLRTSEFGLLQVAAVPWQPVPDWPHGGALLDLLGELDEGWAARLRGVGMRGTLVPDSPLLQLMREQPSLSYARHARYNDLWNDRDRWLQVDNPDPMVLPGWEYDSRASYVANSYHRPATLLRTVERMVGTTTWWTFLRAFAMQSRFRHPTTDDFTRLLRETCGAEVGDFFAEAIRAGATFDYGIDGVRPPDGRGPRKSVAIRRFGALRATVPVRLRFSERAEPVLVQIDAGAADPIHRLHFDDEDEETPWGDLLEVWVDPPTGTAADGSPLENPGEPSPSGIFTIDENLLNNAWRARADRRPALYRAIRGLLQRQSRLSFWGWIG